MSIPPQDLFDHLRAAQERLDAGSSLPPFSTPELDPEAVAILHTAATRMQDNFPYAHPLYAGQMLKPPHPLARAAYALAMSVNPNNHALDGGRASSAMEIEAVAGIARMFSLAQHLGHLSSGGTFANLEALWVAGQLAPEGRRTVAASTQAHYTHGRISGVLGLPFAPVPVDGSNRMDLHVLEAMLKRGEIATVVATLGTTATGAVDPLDRLLVLRQRYGFRLHVDAAYGGYFTLAEELAPEVRAAYDAIGEADSIVIDPHKHGLQPYGCGCVLFRDPAVGALYKHDSPYTYFTSGALHLGEISLECSRAGAAAVALWSTMQLLPLARGGTFSHMLSKCLQAARGLHAHLAADARSIIPSAAPQLDIVVWAIAASSLEASSARAQSIFDEAARHDLHLALARLPVTLFAPGTWPDMKPDDSVLCLRSVLMKPEHLAWLPELCARLDAAAAHVGTESSR